MYLKTEKYRYVSGFEKQFIQASAHNGENANYGIKTIAINCLNESPIVPPQNSNTELNRFVFGIEKQFTQASVWNEEPANYDIYTKPLLLPISTKSSNATSKST